MQFQRNWLLVGRNGVLKVWRWWKTGSSETRKMKSSWGCIMGGPSLVQEPSRKQDHQASKKDQWRGRWGSLLVLTNTILLYFIPLTHWRILIRKVESFLKTGFTKSRVQSLALPGPLSQLFATILVAILFLHPSTIQMNNQCRKEQRQGYQAPNPGDKTPCPDFTWVHEKRKSKHVLSNEKHTTYYKSKSLQPSLTKVVQPQV